MFPIILSSLIFLPEIKIKESQFIGRLLKASLFLLLYVGIYFINVDLGFIEFNFSTNDLYLKSQNNLSTFISLSCIAIFFFVFAKRPESKRKVTLLGILPFIPLGLASEVLIVMVIVSGCLLEDMINAEVPFLAKVGLSLSLFGIFVLDPAYGHLYADLVNEVLTHGISFILVFLILNSDLIFDKKIAQNDGFKTIITLFFIGFLFFLKGLTSFNTEIFNVILVFNLVLFLARVLFKHQYLPIGELFYLNSFVMCWIFTGEFTADFICAFTVLSISLSLINENSKLEMDSKAIVSVLRKYSSFILTIIILQLVILYVIVNLLTTYSQIWSVIFILCFWYHIKTIFKLLLLNSLKNEKRKLANYLMVLAWGALLLIGVTIYA